MAFSGLSRQERKRILTTGDEDMRGFRDHYAGSQKAPDFSVKILDNEGNLAVKFVLEAGFAESHNELVEDARLWLEGMPSVNMVLLVNIQESPVFKTPTQELDMNANLVNFLSSTDIRMSDFEMQGTYGPVQYQGLIWAGTITALDIEIWTRDIDTAEAVKANPTIVSIFLSHLKELY